MKRALLLIMLTSLTGCYSYEHSTQSTMPTGKSEVKRKQIRNGRT